jgi:hypothetical protein
MGLGNLIDVDTTQPIDIPTLATTVTRLLTTTYDLTPERAGEP